MVGIRKLAAVALFAAAVASSGCAPSGTTGGDAPTTTTSRFGTGRIDGLTENRFCGGPVSPSGCQAPYRPGSDRVTLVPHIPVEPGMPVIDPLVINSDADGRFGAELVAGEWVLTAAPLSSGGSTDCPSAVVDVVAGSTTSVTLRCTVELP